MWKTISLTLLAIAVLGALAFLLAMFVLEKVAPLGGK